jgi:hypothetical protein
MLEPRNISQTPSMANHRDTSLSWSRPRKPNNWQNLVTRVELKEQIGGMIQSSWFRYLELDSASDNCEIKIESLRISVTLKWQSYCSLSL